jgi:hypothetical protein
MIKNGIKIKYSGGTFKKTSKHQIKQEILQSTSSSPENRREIARIFQIANRRIQNIERSGLLSPAVSALNKGHITRYTKFGMKHDWQTLKTEYAKAISFLRQPTSTLTGLREYNNHLKSVYDLSDQEFELMSKSLNNKLSSISDSDFVERYLMRYKDFTGELEAESRDISDQIESEAYRLERAIDDEIDRAADAVLREQERGNKLIRKTLEYLNKYVK